MNKCATAFLTSLTTLVVAMNVWAEPQAQPSDAIVIRGLDPSIAVVAQLAQAYQAKTATEVYVEGAGSSASIESTLNGGIDLVFMGTRIGDADLPSDLVSFEYARDGIKIVVHPDNPVSDLSADDINRIFTSQRAVWEDKTPMLAMTADAWSASTRQCLEQIQVDQQPVAETVQSVSEEELISSVAGEPHAIGCLPISTSLDPGQLKAITINGVKPTSQSVLNGQYPLSRSLVFASKSDPAPNVQAFLDFVLGQEGQQIVRETGLLPVGKTVVQTAEVETDSQ